MVQNAIGDKKFVQIKMYYVTGHVEVVDAYYTHIAVIAN